MKIITVVGARPQFVKAAVLSRLIQARESVKEVIIHTGQHFDTNMSKVFFQQMDIPEPDYNLNINSLSHGAMTGRMIQGIEELIVIEKPDWLLVYGDTNSTIAGALAAKKLQVNIAHVEAGLRSFNRAMPEEINRILTDRISDILFCPTSTAIENLKNEGIAGSSVVLSGDVMLDAVRNYLPQALVPEADLPQEFILATIHRQENTDDKERLYPIFEALNMISVTLPVVIPLHPRTAKLIDRNKWQNICFIDPVSYFEMLFLLKHCSLVFTDSGGLQKEAFFLAKPCVTVRDQTEWVELIDNGFNMLTAANIQEIISKIEIMLKRNLDFSIDLYGNGDAGGIILNNLMK
ncbi:MAG: UDP-N-acetylglucosamine 2-epimerase (non-hydrolyzing) [Candidatus Cloacimonetes bacterium]|nr:UDP-N-acetylglucosamine 2-epimerase (non-hydrolyzing) [Candidatus Cloacimonadota bacterium]